MCVCVCVTGDRLYGSYHQPEGIMSVKLEMHIIHSPWNASISQSVGAKYLFGSCMAPKKATFNLLGLNVISMLMRHR